MTIPPADLRPTSERARQAYFNIVGGRIEGARFLDLFAGSGIFSFEALSRGAASATAVERDTRNVALIAKEAAAFGVQVKTVTADALQFVRRAAEPFDLVYADPPYAYEDYIELVEVIGKLPLPPRALVAVEHRRGMRPFQQETGRLRLIRTAEYGEVWISFFGIAEAATGIAIGE